MDSFLYLLGTLLRGWTELVSAFYDRSSQGNIGGGTEEDENWAKNGEYVGQSLLTTRAVAELGEAEFCELTCCPPPTNKQNNTSHNN